MVIYLSNICCELFKLSPFHRKWSSVIGVFNLHECLFSPQACPDTCCTCPTARPGQWNSFHVTSSPSKSVGTALSCCTSSLSSTCSWRCPSCVTVTLCPHSSFSVTVSTSSPLHIWGERVACRYLQVCKNSHNTTDLSACLCDSHTHTHLHGFCWNLTLFTVGILFMLGRWSCWWILLNQISIQITLWAGEGHKDRSQCSQIRSASTWTIKKNTFATFLKLCVTLSQSLFISRPAGFGFKTLFKTVPELTYNLVWSYV